MRSAETMNNDVIETTAGAWILRGVRMLIAGVALAMRALLRGVVDVLLRVVVPPLRAVLTAVGVLGVVATLLLAASGAAPQLPIWGLIGASVACMLASGALDALARAVRRR
jgi:hypothetical protein